MANYVIIPEVYIKEEPVEFEGERSSRNGGKERDPFQPDDEEDGFLHDKGAGRLPNSPQHPSTPPLNLSRSNTSPLNFSSRHSSPPLDLSRSSTPPLNLCKVKREKEEEEEEDDDDDLRGELSPDEEALDGESEVDTGSASIFEPEVSIESEDEDVQCNLDDDEGDYNLDDEEEHDDDYLPRVRKRGTSNSRNVPSIEKKYQCPLCGKYFLTSSAMNGHVAKGHGTTLGIKFVCHVCGAPGSSRASLKRHLIRTHKLKNVDHPELLTKKCVHCGIGFASHILLYEHIRSVHSDKVQEYHNCNWCPALMRAKASLIRHIRRTHPGKEEPLLTSEKCSHCEECFSSKFLLQRHVKSNHPNLPPANIVKKAEENRKKKRYSVECEFCGRKFGSKPRLQYHIEVVHTNPPIKIYTCRMCGLTFPTAKQNNRHYRKVHRPERQKIHCGKCNITFKTPEECSQHRSIHPNTCEICQKQFLRRDSLREHLLIHSAPRHQCPHCTKKFTQRSNLKRHIRVHTGEKPYKCTFCSRCFSDKSACNSHIRVHTGYERSVCSVCGASFSKKQRLNYHMRMHTGEGLLYCPLCMRPNTNSYSLRKHIESHQQPLTKALTSIGFRPLLVSDPNFVMRALQALTQATLQNISRHENIPNSFKEEIDEMKEMNGTATATALSGITTPEERDVEECTKSLSNIGNFKAEPGSEADETSPSEEYFRVNDKEAEPRFDLTKFLQGLLEKESLKVRTDRRNRKDRRMRRSSLRSTSQGASSRLEDERESDEEELPTTVGDELVKQCLEIIMKDEPQTDDEYDENGMYSDDGMEYQMDCDQLTTEFVIKTEPHDEYDFESDQELEREELDPGDYKQPSTKGIPKIKISRVTNSNSDSKDLFVAEIVKKK